MRKSKLYSLLALLVATSIMLAACGGGATPAPANGPATDGGGAQVTSSGFECPEPNPRMEVTSTELNLFVWTEYFPQDMLDCFELVYDIQLNRDEYSSNEEMYPKLSAGGAAYDLAQPTDYIIGLMISNGLLQELDHSKLTNMKNFDEGWMNQDFDPGNKYSIPYLAGTDAIVVNTDTVENVPQSWADLWKPEYAGRMIALDDSRVLIGATLLTLGYDVNTTDPEQLDEAKAKLAKLIPNIKVFDSDSPKTALIAGDVDLGITWTFEALAAQQENPAIQFIYPTEGAIIWQDNWVMLKDASHADAAYAWLNYINQGDVFWLTLVDYTYINPNRAALEYAKENHPDIYNAYFDSPITNPPPEVIANGHGIEDVGEATPLYDAIWVEVKGQ
ncbi:MAG: spermidine/putrescine ABC transporter substrate-binding protein [Chloroflexi bacterium]|nr:MAG: spermidine/putrescine ABC transporter substrate-binding protein [Chloroflexota bacterium]